MTIKTPGGRLDMAIALAGAYNAYNVLAAVATATALGVDLESIRDGVSSFRATFGRQERMTIGDRQVEMLLAKNPAGLNQVLNTLVASGEPLNILLLLNDDIADGRDISWIWDVDFELLSGQVQSLSVSGRRAWDMALRVKYAGLTDSPQVNGDTGEALREALARTPAGGRLHVIPTYTAMLEVRNLLGKWAGKGAFWEESAR
jgi:UDP-N-acetylmuramyl tripeptide synthase